MKKLTTEQVVEQFVKIHGDRYDYSKVVYSGNKVKVEIICKEHGSFWQTPNNHKNKNGCPDCVCNKLKSTEECISDFKKVHGDQYDYSKVKYINSLTDVIIICKDHGKFLIKPKAHLLGVGCPDKKCSIRGVRRRKSINLCISDFKNIHNDQYDYSKVKNTYSNSTTKVEIICKTHGSFWQIPNDHISGKGCSDCGKLLISVKKSKSLDFVISQFREVHGDRYDYSKVQYFGNRTKVEMICDAHGIFWQEPLHHLVGQGCSKCSSVVSSVEIEIADWIKRLGVYVKCNQRGLFKNSNFEADIVIPSKKIIIEYNGSIWHSEKFARSLYNIFEKTKMANKAGYRCIHIREDLYLKNPERVKSLLKSALGLFDNKIGARQTEKRTLTLQEYKDLCGDHLQGYRSAKVKKGLFYKGKLVACIGYNNSGELIRYVVKNGWLVLGALPKLLKGETVTFSFCDLSFFTGESYYKAGFKLEYITKPNYIYVKSNMVRSRQQMMKHKLHKLFDNFDSNLTEVQNCNNNGWFRLFDAGNAKFIKV